MKIATMPKDHAMHWNRGPYPLCYYCEQNEPGDFIPEAAMGPCCFGQPSLPWPLGPWEGCFDVAQRIGWEQMNQDTYLGKRWNAKMASCTKAEFLLKHALFELTSMTRFEARSDSDELATTRFRPGFVILKISSYIFVNDTGMSTLGDLYQH
jgi:hypothetical protein